MFGVGFSELLVILIIVLVIFGPGKLPAIGASLGKSMREFKNAFNGADLADTHSVSDSQKDRDQNAG